jgi:hypothetical protein
MECTNYSNSAGNFCFSKVLHIKKVLHIFVSSCAYEIERDDPSSQILSSPLQLNYIEAMEAHESGDKKIIDHMTVVDD